MYLMLLKERHRLQRKTPRDKSSLEFGFESSFTLVATDRHRTATPRRTPVDRQQVHRLQHRTVRHLNTRTASAVRHEVRTFTYLKRNNINVLNFRHRFLFILVRISSVNHYQICTPFKYKGATHYNPSDCSTELLHFHLQ